MFTWEPLDGMPSVDWAFGDAEVVPRLLKFDPVEPPLALPPEVVLLPSPVELPQGLPSFTSTGTATLRGEL